MNKINELRTLAFIHKPSIILITETWLTHNISNDEIDINDYHSYRGDRLIGNGGGCMIYVNKDYSSNYFSFDMPPTDIDQVWVIMTISEKRQVLLGCVYNPPGHRTHIDTHLSSIMNKASDIQTKYKIIGGDFNLPDIAWEQDSHPNRLTKFSNALEHGDWKQHVRTPTRLNNLLDLLFTFNINEIEVSIDSPLSSSDHNMVKASLSIPHNTHLSTPITQMRRDLKNLNESNIQSVLNTLEWSTFLTTDNLPECSKLYYHNILTCLDILAPLKSVNKQFKSQNYIPDNIKRRLKKLKRLYHINHDISAIAKINEIFMNLEDRRLNKLRYQELKADSSDQPSASFTKLYKNRLHHRDDIPSLILDDTKNRLIEIPAEICSAFANHFSSCYTDMKYDNISPLTAKTSSSFGKIIFYKEDIMRIISFIKCSNSQSPDGIHTNFYKQSKLDISIFLMKLYNLSIETSTYPKEWRISYVHPKHKIGSRQNVKNYRPINVTAIASRIMERIIKKQLLSYLAENKLISDFQYGFLPKKSCTSCQVEFLDLVTELRDQGHSVLILYFDFKKAFDTVPHYKLLAKISKYGIIDPLRAWINSFLTDRYQIVNIDSHYSSPQLIKSGVIQGSVLGPVLFLLYIDDILNEIKHGQPFLYADDLKIVYKFSDNNLQSHVQLDLDMLSSWCRKWDMSLNNDKCFIMRMGKCPNDLVLLLNNTTMQYTDKVKDLGITYNSQLSFTEHIRNITAKAARTCGFICRNFHLNKTKTALYKMFIRPKLEFCSFIFSNAKKSDVERIERVQRKYTKRIIKSSSNTYTDRCNILVIPPLWLRRLKLNLKILYKMIHNLSLSNRKMCFYSPTSYHLRNNTNVLRLISCRKQMRSKFFLVRYRAIWNKLPEDIRTCDSLNKFTCKLNTFLNMENAETLLKTYDRKVDMNYGAY